MKRFATLFVALGLVTAGSAAFADQKDQRLQKKPAVAPIAMTDAQLDKVAAGAPLIDLGSGLIDVNVNNVANNNEVVKNVTVNAAVAAAVGVLSRGTGAGAVVIP